MTVREVIEKHINLTSNDGIARVLNSVELLKSDLEKERLLKIMSKKTGLAHPADQQMVISANFPGLIDIAIGEDNKTGFLIKERGRMNFVKEWREGDVLYVPPDAGKVPFLLPRAERVIQHFTSDDDKVLYNDLSHHLRQYSYLSEGSRIIVECFVFLSYLHDHPDISYMPEILLFAVAERGKSRTAKALIFVSFRGIHTPEFREANIFRFSHNLKATICFDIKNLWEKAKVNRSEDILLARFEKGQKVARVLHPEAGPFNDMVFYDIFGPTLLVTNEPVHKILGTRCIPIIMTYRPGKYKNPKPQDSIEMKERLTAWRARVMDTALPILEPIQSLEGRLWDISQPLLQICQIVYPQGMNLLRRVLEDVATQKMDTERETIEGQIVAMLRDLSSDHLLCGNREWAIQTGDILKQLKMGMRESKLTPQYIGKKMRAMGLHTRKVRGYSEVVLNLPEFRILLRQYGLDNIQSHDAVTQQNSTSLHHAPDTSGNMVENCRDSLVDSEEITIEGEIA